MYTAICYFWVFSLLFVNYLFIHISLLPYLYAKRKQVKGQPIAITDHGLIPFNKKKSHSDFSKVFLPWQLSHSRADCYSKSWRSRPITYTDQVKRYFFGRRQ